MSYGILFRQMENRPPKCYICRQLCHYSVCPFRIIHRRRLDNICYLCGHL